MKCPNCGAEIRAGKFCEFCGSAITIEMKREQEQINMNGCPQCGSSNIQFKRENQGEVRGKKSKQIIHRTVGLCKDCGATWYPNTVENEIPKKRRTWLWVLGWIFIFPVPLTILMLRKKEMKPILKYGIIAVAWIVYLLIGYAGNTSNEGTPATQQEQTSAVAETIPDIKEQFKEEIGDASVLFDNSVPNDTTGLWRLTRMATQSNILDHAATYYNAYFESDDEIHFVINFTLNTTAVIMKNYDHLDITIHEYVEDEEHDAKTLGSGAVLGQYWVYLVSGEIEDISNS